MPEFELTASPSPEELAVITDALSAFNNADVGPSDRRPLAVLIRDTDGKVTGGLSGFTAWGWLSSSSSASVSPSGARIAARWRSSTR